MGLFSKRPATPPPAAAPVHEKRSLFSSKPTATTTTTPTTVPARHSSILHKDRSLAASSTKDTITSNHGTTAHSTSKHGVSSLLHRDKEDASITAARERVISAEAAEREADRALVVARESVREARAVVKRLEAEAKEEARLAMIKQKQAAKISQRGSLLGRHGGGGAV